MAATLTILVPAAGASSRMRGRDKLMERIGPETMLARTVRLARGVASHVVATIPDGGPFSAPRAAVLRGTGAEVIAISDYHDGMSASIRAGARAAAMSEGLMILLPDMPEVTGEDIARVAEAFALDPAHPARGASADGTPGHPVILPRRLFADLAVLTGDHGARKVLEGLPVQLVLLPDRHALTDLDTPEDWNSWQAPTL
ncbi:nucleotidyltransferase family protein [Frigidibacter sp. SD6-1]|uniref:nucleotidyltransferase family protein n=1 Tax=Frigidibacter sp. SD6-1 TaxID=3032581 RepID=UPI0024E03023|nr:nucleotidyltransferase family protein [Frigidibacter sp. SD6-1]